MLGCDCVPVSGTRSCGIGNYIKVSSTGTFARVPVLFLGNHHIRVGRA